MKTSRTRRCNQSLLISTANERLHSSHQDRLRRTSGGPDNKILRQLEADDRLRRDVNIPISSQAAQRRSSTCTDEAANQQTNTAGGDTADQHTQSGAAPDERRRSLPLTLFRLGRIVRVERVTRAAQCDIGEPQLQNR